MIRKVKTIRVCRRCLQAMWVWCRRNVVARRALCPACLDLEVLRLKEENCGKANG